MNNLKSIKRAVLIALGAALLLAVAGCSREPVSPYKDGTYTATWASPDRDGYAEFVTLEIKKGVLTVADLDGKNASEEFKTNDSDLFSAMLDASEESGGPQLFPKKIYETLTANFVAAGGDLEQMELVAGATRSSRSFVTLVDSILSGPALEGATDTVVLPFYTDGTYEVSLHSYDLFGYRDYVKLTVSGGVPKLVEADAKNREGALKSADTELKSPVSPGEVYPSLTAALAEGVEGIYELEAIAGATQTSTTFERLVTAALDNSHFRGEQRAEIKNYVDGEYRAEMAVFENNWKDYLVITVKNDNVTVKEYGSKNAAGEQKTSSTELKTKMAEHNSALGLPEITPEQFSKDIIAAFEASRDDVTAMENIAGATVSTNNFKLMMGELLGYNAAYGITETREVQPYNTGTEAPEGGADGASSAVS